MQDLPSLERKTKSHGWSVFKDHIDTASILQKDELRSDSPGHLSALLPPKTKKIHKQCP